MPFLRYTLARLNPRFSQRGLNVMLFCVVMIIAVGLLFPETASAAFDTLKEGIANILLAFAGFFGRITVTLIGILIGIAQYNDFINAPAVAKGWVIVRDVVNMFFIVVLLLIAFGSVFHIEEYQYKKVLGKLLIMAVLVNFSKSITGFFIDFAQVITLTFVNGFKEAAAPNFLNGFHIQEMFNFATQDNPEIADKSMFLAAAALALVTILISMIVVFVYTIVFILRIVALWFLTIISPIAYALSAFPGDARKYSSQWWDYFGKYVTTGPILAFFLWLSLAVMQFSNSALGDFLKTDKSSAIKAEQIPAAAISGIGQSDILLSFVINIILLMGGLWMTQQLGVAGGKLAATAMNKIQGAGMAIAKSPFKAAWGATKLMATSANQAIVRKTKGRLSLDPRDYIKAFKEVREDRRAEAYQQFYGHKKKFLKEWATPSGVGRLIAGSISRSRAKKEVSRLADEDNELKEKLKNPHKGETYREELKAEYADLERKTQEREEAINNLPEGERKKTLQAEQAKDQARMDEILNLQNLSDDQLSEKYVEKINGEIEQKQERIRQLEQKLKLSTKTDKMTDEEKKEEANKQIERNKTYLASEENLNSEKIEKTKSELESLNESLAKTSDDAERKKIVDQIKILEDDLAGLEKDRVKISSDKKKLNEDEKLVEKGDKETIERLAFESVAPEEIIQERQKELAKEKTEKEKSITQTTSEINDLEKTLQAEQAKPRGSRDEGMIRAIEDELKLLKEKKSLLELERAEIESLKKKIDDLKPQDRVVMAKQISETWQSENKSAQEDIESLKKKKAMPDLSLAEREEMLRRRKQIQSRIKEIRSAWYQTKEPADYYVERERRSNVHKEMQKVTSENSDELLPEFEKAVASNNEALAIAIAMKLANDANLNELMNHYGYKSNFEGLNDFRKDILQQKLGLDEQAALQYQNDLSFAAERVNHWAMARTVGYDVNKRKFTELSAAEHTQAALTEMLKIEPQRVARDFNRLAYGGEVVLSNGKRQFQIDELGKQFFEKAQHGLLSQMSRFNINAAIKLAEPQTKAILQQMVNEGRLQTDLLRQIKERASGQAYHGKK